MTVEVDHIIGFHRASGAPGIPTEINHVGWHAPTSYHYSPHARPSAPQPLDTQGGKVGSAVDFGFTVGQIDSPGLRAICSAFAAVDHLLAEMIHTSFPYFVHNGRRLPIGQLDPALAAEHRNHVHISTAAGTFLPIPSAPIHQEPIMPSQVDACLAPKGHWVLTSDGGVRAIGGAPFYGCYWTLPAEQRQGSRSFVAIEPTPQGGYVTFGDDDSFYEFNPPQ